MIEHHDQYAAAEGAQIAEADGDVKLYVAQERTTTTRTVESMSVEIERLREIITDLTRENLRLFAAYVQGAEAMRSAAAIRAAAYEEDGDTRGIAGAIFALPIPERRP